MTIRKLRSGESPDRLYQRLADIQIERAHVLDGTRLHSAGDEDYGGARSDALHDLAMEERWIRRALRLPPGEWTAGVWPDWMGWSLLTGLVVGIFLVAWIAG
jgi:hypothetical protein